MAEEEKKLTINKEEENEAEDIQPVLDDKMKEISGGGLVGWPISPKRKPT